MPLKYGDYPVRSAFGILWLNRGFSWASQYQGKNSAYILWFLLKSREPHEWRAVIKKVFFDNLTGRLTKNLLYVLLFSEHLFLGPCCFSPRKKTYKKSKNVLPPDEQMHFGAMKLLYKYIRYARKIAVMLQVIH